MKSTSTYTCEKNSRAYTDIINRRYYVVVLIFEWIKLSLSRTSNLYITIVNVQQYYTYRYKIETSRAIRVVINVIIPSIYIIHRVRTLYILYRSDTIFQTLQYRIIYHIISCLQVPKNIIYTLPVRTNSRFYKKFPCPAAPLYSFRPNE